MRDLEKKVDALMTFCTARTEEDRQAAMATLRRLLISAEEKPRDAESIVRNILLDIGIPDHILGHRYLVTALTLAAQDKSFADNMTKGVYPAVAMHHSTTKSRAERAIRHAVELAWERGDMDVLAYYFGNTVNMVKGKPTNGEFIARISNVVRRQL